MPSTSASKAGYRQSAVQAPSILQDADTKGGHNDGAAANWKQKKSLNARSFKAAKNAQHLKVLMQRAYDYHSDFGVRAQVVIAKHIDKEGWTPEEICEVVAYVTPKQHKCVNDKGETILVNPPVYPYMWKECIGDEADADAYHGSFRRSLHPQHVHTVPRKCPRARCLLLQSLSNEHGTYGQWDKGLWSFSTDLIMESIDNATHRKWKKIFKGAAPFIDAHQKRPTWRAQVQAKGIPALTYR
ncbi:hypothetical protein F4604DRAFT_1941837 [Suillus subluteus]|nr:hypothetical protein F4604DRAFT_1941837 [Suillus subluteus]